MDVVVGDRVRVSCHKFGCDWDLVGVVVETGGMGRFVVAGRGRDFRVKPSRQAGKFDVIAKRRQVFRGADIEVV